MWFHLHLFIHSTSNEEEISISIIILASALNGILDLRVEKVFLAQLCVCAASKDVEWGEVIEDENEGRKGNWGQYREKMSKELLLLYFNQYICVCSG